MTDEQQDAVAALAALGQSTRLALFQTLARSGADGLSAGAIANKLGVKQNTLSSHLSILERAGMIAHRRDGRSLIYRPSFFGMRSLMKFLLQECCDNHPAVAKPLLAQLSLTQSTAQTSQIENPQSEPA